MALSRSPIELAETVRVIEGLQNDMSLLFLNAHQIPLRLELIPGTGRLMKRPNTCLCRTYFLTNDLKKGITLFEVGLYHIQKRLILIGGNDV